MRRSHVLVPLAVLVAAYTAIAVSSYPRELGRAHPGRASWFRPPLFNFADDYSSGSVMGFRIGERANDLERRLTAPGARSIELNALCDDKRGLKAMPINETWVKVTQVDRLRELLGRDTICIFGLDDRLFVQLDMSDGAVRKIHLSYVRNELI